MFPAVSTTRHDHVAMFSADAIEQKPTMANATIGLCFIVLLPS